MSNKILNWLKLIFLIIFFLLFFPALSTTVALIIFPVAIENDLKMLTHHYGTGYGLGWGGTIFFFAAALCMSLDDIVRESSTSICCGWCMGSGGKQQQRRGGGGTRAGGGAGGRAISQNRTELQQVWPLQTDKTSNTNQSR